MENRKAERTVEKKRSEIGIRILIAAVTAVITAGVPLLFQASQPAEPLQVVLQDLREQEPEAFDQYIESELKSQEQVVMRRAETEVRFNGSAVGSYTAEGETYVSLPDLLQAGGGELTLGADGTLALSGGSAPGSGDRDASPEGGNWLEACAPYELGAFELVLESEGDSMEIGGVSYTDGLLSDAAWNSQVLFNLQGKYRTLTVTAGHVDGSAMVDCTYNFYVDGKNVKTVTLKADALPVTIEVPLDYGQQLKIENLDTVAYTEFGFVDGYFAG